MKSSRHIFQAADSIADPADYPNLFEGLEHALEAEAWLLQHRLQEAPSSVCVA